MREEGLCLCRVEKCDNFINHETMSRAFFGFLLLLEDEKAINFGTPCKQAKQDQTTIHNTILLLLIAEERITYLVECLLRYIMPYISLKYT